MGYPRLSKISVSVIGHSILTIPLALAAFLTVYNYIEDRIDPPPQLVPADYVEKPTEAYKGPTFLTKKKATYDDHRRRRRS